MMKHEEKGLLSLTHAAQYLDTTPKSLRHWVKREGCPMKRIGMRIVFVKKDLDEWFQTLPSESEYRRKMHGTVVPMSNDNPKGRRRGRPVKPPVEQVT